MREQVRLPRLRAGFSLIELLVVIAIITILVALLAGAVIHMMAVPPQKNTELTLKKVAAAINTQWAAVADKARQDAYIPTTFPGGAQDARRDAYVFAMLQQEFPNTASAATTPPAGLPGNAYYQGYTNWAAIPANYQAAVCLYMILSTSHAGKTFDTDTLGSHEVGVLPVAGGKSVKYLKDGWGNPIQFTIAAGVYPQFSSWGPDGQANTIDDLIYDTHGMAQNVLP